MKFVYLLVLFFTVIIPAIFSFHSKLRFYKHWKAFFMANSIVALAFIIWDIKFTELGIWGFNPNYLTGIYILFLPLEEVLFFICIPFACVFTYYCLTLFYTFNWGKKTENILVYSLSAVLIVGGIHFSDKLYTSSVFLSLGGLLFAIKVFSKTNWLARPFTVYLFLLIPFFIVNGVLTGSGLDAPVVWYNNSENLGLRLFTIPIEDVFYGFELILLNILLFDFFKIRFYLKEKSQQKESIELLQKNNLV
ncbi:MAG: lycopene cyclase domain-containing protein [Bacteroidota bacterium]|nr:lycopene cyclase domain-containing protein [Bacteroidota bacterium]